MSLSRPLVRECLNDSLEKKAAQKSKARHHRNSRTTSLDFDTILLSLVLFFCDSMLKSGRLAKNF